MTKRARPKDTAAAHRAERLATQTATSKDRVSHLRDEQEAADDFIEAAIAAARARQTGVPDE